jgi:hypothetical protein
MTATEIYRVVIQYHDELNRRGYNPMRADTTKPHDQRGAPVLCHTMWMCNTMASIDNEEKLNRWLGFIQGVLWSHGIYSVDELREHNR